MNVLLVVLLLVVITFLIYKALYGEEYTEAKLFCEECDKATQHRIVYFKDNVKVKYIYCTACGAVQIK